MTFKTAVADGYRSANDRLAATDWTRLALIYAAVHLAVAVWVVYVELLSLKNGPPDLLTLSIGLDGIVGPAVYGLLVAVLVAPICAVGLVALGHVLPTRRVYAHIVAPWVVLCPGALSAITAAYVHWTGFKLFWFMVDADPWTYLEWAGMWVVLATLFVSFVGGSYTVATRYPEVSQRATYVLVAVIVLVAAIPMGVAVAGPGMNDTIDAPAYDEPTYEQLTDPAVYQGNEPNPDYEQYDLDVRPAIDPNADDWGDHHLFTGEPYLEPKPPVPYNITETHTGGEYFGATDLVVETDDSEVPVEGHYYFRFDPPIDTIGGNHALINADTHRTAWDDGRSTTTNVPDGELYDLEGTLKMENTESMWVYYDIYHENGEIHRYQVYLDRDDVNST